MKSIFLIIIWISYISALLIYPLRFVMSDILIGIILAFTTIYIVQKNDLNSKFINKYLIQILAPLLFLILLSGLYGQFKIFFYLIFSLLSCWMGFLLGNRIHILPVNNFYYPLAICSITSLGVILGVRTTFSSIASILLLVPWLFYSKNFILFWTYSSFISLATFSRAIILALYFTISIFFVNKKFSIIMSLLGIILLVLIISNIDAISVFWTVYIKSYLLETKPMEENRTKIWSYVLSNLNPGTFIFGQSQYINYSGISSHNGFLQAYVKLGMPGLILLLSTPILIIKKYINIKTFNSKILISITFLYFFREIFEVTIIENFFYFAGFYWFIIGILFRRIEEENFKRDL